ncbi:MAG: pyridoxal-phosphate dependent enzyme [Lacibacter sp.]
MQSFLQNIQCGKAVWPLKDKSPFHFTVARFDLIHPFISGNKYFKLKYNLQRLHAEGKKAVITMGGAYSNHLAATAFACYKEGLTSIGLVRGEVAEPLNPTLSFCRQHHMQLIPVDRKDYNRNSSVVEQIKKDHADMLFIPEGGDNEEGLLGCKEMLSMIEYADSFTHILCCMGTGTTFKGIAASAKAHQTVIGIPVLKIREDEKEMFIKNHATIHSVATKKVLFNYAGDGYAKFSSHQLNFMNSFYTKNNIPTDIIYTGKLMMAVADLAEQDFFPPGSKLLAVHSGGLQGNNSLPPGILVF